MSKAIISFVDILVAGIEDPYNKENLTAYFIREYRKALPELFNRADDFFRPLFAILEQYKKAIDVNAAQQISWLKKRIEKAKNNELYFPIQVSGAPFQEIDCAEYQHEKNKEEVVIRRQQLENFSKDAVVVNQNIDLTLPELAKLETALKEAEASILLEALRPQPPDSKAGHNGENFIISGLLQRLNTNNLLFADDLMYVAQLYERMAKNSIKKAKVGKVKYDPPGILKEIINKLQSRTPDVDVETLFYNLYYLTDRQTFENIQQGQRLVRDLQILNIEIPVLVEDCLCEVETRTRICKKLANGGHQWSIEKIQSWKKSIESEGMCYSYDHTSHLKYLQGRFSDTIEDIKKLKDQAHKKYGYHIESFYKDGAFVAAEDDLNYLFFHGEIYAGGYNVFHDIFLLLINYIEKHNEAAQLKILIAAPTKKTKTTVKIEENNEGQEDFIFNALKANNFVDSNNKYIPCPYGESETMDGFLIRLFEENLIRGKSVDPMLKYIYDLIGRQFKKYNHNPKSPGYKKGRDLGENYILELNSSK